MKNDIDAIKQRNKRVELDKAWERSVTRRLLISIITYVTVVVYSLVANVPQPYTTALIPSGAYLVSTLSLPYVKNWWLRKQ